MNDDGLVHGKSFRDEGGGVASARCSEQLRKPLFFHLKGWLAARGYLTTSGVPAGTSLMHIKNGAYVDADRRRKRHRDQIGNYKHRTGASPYNIAVGSGNRVRDLKRAGIGLQSTR
ncbi:hypothetical protein [Massilia consociata]|uniref:Uncharacterized protein n=1 Tax=Massilia consociata TaxID=760117 RepID=A0ABV6FFX9_9BURK